MVTTHYLLTNNVDTRDPIGSKNNCDYKNACMQVQNPHLISTYHSFPIFKDNVQYLVFTSVVDAAESFPPESVIGDPSPRCWSLSLSRHCRGGLWGDEEKYGPSFYRLYHIQQLMCGKQQARRIEMSTASAGTGAGDMFGVMMMRHLVCFL